MRGRQRGIFKIPNHYPNRSFGHLMTQICAIIGGIFTVAGIVDALFYKTLHVIQKKIELGKFS